MFKSSSFRPLFTAQLYRRNGYTANGRERHGPAQRLGVSIVTVREALEQTSVRTDQSGSQGSAEEIHADTRLMVDPKVAIGLGDKVVLHEDAYRVARVQPRWGMDGALHHNEVDLIRWVSASGG